jgi:hypothetical protein
MSGRHLTAMRQVFTEKFNDRETDIFFKDVLEQRPRMGAVSDLAPSGDRKGVFTPARQHQPLFFANALRGMSLGLVVPRSSHFQKSWMNDRAKQLRFQGTGA